MIDAVVTHHTDASRSGVARFNELLAAHLGVPVLSVSNDRAKGLSHPLLSFKVSELDRGEAADLEGLLAAAHGRGVPFYTSTRRTRRRVLDDSALELEVSGDTSDTSRGYAHVRDSGAEPVAQTSARAR